ncbi:hypothetical protein [Aquabacterium sp. NJ1]|uniref:hypothetical protein n=1 Tax=Aquabacterium sp. NJ1 TaxID=1538295 RepID=UPI00126A27F3|nr:hypothetical protein [Aquabacterium sp. NJ1]
MAEIANGIAFQLEILGANVIVTQGADRLLTVKVFSHSFTGNIDQVYAWANALKATLKSEQEGAEPERDSDFEP